jgi:hypothetical protein
MQKRYWLGRTPDVGALISKILLWPVLFLEVFRAPVIYVRVLACEALLRQEMVSI